MPRVQELDFAEEVLPNLRLSIRKEVDEQEDPFAYAMHFLYKNFSDVSNKDRFPEMVEVPSSVRPEAVLLPSVSAYVPPESIMHFKVGNFSQRLIFFKDVEKPKWDKLEQDHLDKFYAFCKTKQLAPFPKWYPEAEILR